MSTRPTEAMLFRKPNVTDRAPGTVFISYLLMTYYFLCHRTCLASATPPTGKDTPTLSLESFCRRSSSPNRWTVIWEIGGETGFP